TSRPARRPSISARRSRRTTSRSCWHCSRCRCLSCAPSTAWRRAPAPTSRGTYFLPRLVGSARAMGLALLGDKLHAEDAERWGLIWACVDDADLGGTV